MGGGADCVDVAVIFLETAVLSGVSASGPACVLVETGIPLAAGKPCVCGDHDDHKDGDSVTDDGHAEALVDGNEKEILRPELFLSVHVSFCNV